MAPKTTKPKNQSANDNTWTFFGEIRQLLVVFADATVSQRIYVLGIALVAAMFVSLGLFGLKGTLPWWVYLIAFVLTIVVIAAAAVTPLVIEKRKSAADRCRQVPIYPPSEATTRAAIRNALEEIRKDFADQVCASINGFQASDIRANIFLLAQTVDDEWLLVIHDDFAINMNHPPERNLRFHIGQGATGVAYRDGTYQLTRRQPSDSGDWDSKFQMTPSQDEQVDDRLKWIVSFPLKTSATSETVGVLNIDGLEDVSNNALLNTCATNVLNKVEDIACTLSLQPSICVGNSQLGVMKYG